MWRRRRYRYLAVAVVPVAITVALWPVYVRPQADPLARADAIVVLGGAHDGREELGLQLAAAGWAPQVVFSNPYAYSSLMSRICHGGYSFRVSCFRPDPGTTRGEGREIARRAEQEGWHRVIVVTFTPHVSRSRYIIGRCWDGDITMAAVPSRLSPQVWAFNYIYQSFGYARAVLEKC
ncbi:YdcF family protein [Skermania piniformis]|uniref:YdcF family protein n=1 Tax=Skermania pinensis TaxID=39122 RepID=A0ABX8S7L3_9ACTN|nr:YdcF family protein [Skermania piniformis]QXQ13799.1 YdcF family protein [Skermania piniformis]